MPESRRGGFASFNEKVISAMFIDRLSTYAYPRDLCDTHKKTSTLACGTNFELSYVDIKS